MVKLKREQIISEHKDKIDLKDKAFIDDLEKHVEKRRVMKIKDLLDLRGEILRIEKEEKALEEEKLNTSVFALLINYLIIFS